MDSWMKLAPPPRALAPGDKWNVFLSYRSVNRPWVLNLYDILRQLGYTVFIDQCELPVGSQLVDRLQEALQASQSGVLIWSEATNDSSWVSREYQALERIAGNKQGFHFVPVALDKSKLPLFAENRIYLDFSSYPDGPNGGELLRLVHALSGKALSPEAVHFALEQDEAAQIAEVKVRAAIRNGVPERVLQLAKEGGGAWEVSSALGCKAAEGLTKLGRNDDAIALLDDVRRRFPRAIRPKQLYALALARRGKEDDLAEAQEILGTLYEQKERDPETVGIYARTWMDRYQKSGDQADLRQSRDLYAEAFAHTSDDYYTGINAAAKSVLLNTPEDLEKAEKYAEQVQKIVGTEAKAGDYWLSATVAELLLIRKNYEQAGRVYEAAVATAPKDTGSHESTCKQACRLMKVLKPSAGQRTAVRKAFQHLPDCS